MWGICLRERVKNREKLITVLYFVFCLEDTSRTTDSKLQNKGRKVKNTIYTVYTYKRGTVFIVHIVTRKPPGLLF